MITIDEIKKNPLVIEFLNQAKSSLRAQGYTEHGLEHAQIVAERAKKISKEIGLTNEEQELSEIAGFCHDIGNFLSRSHHHYLGALIFQQIFSQSFTPEELASIMQAISSHDKNKSEFSNNIAAVLVLADKSDVRASRVLNTNIDNLSEDIHDRVNYATKSSETRVDKKNKRITLVLEIDTNLDPIIEYFEIFTERMVVCRKAAQYLNYKFGLVINDFKLL